MPEARTAAATEPRSPSTKVLVVGAAVVGGVALLTALSSRGGLFGTTGTTKLPATKLPVPAQVPIPTQPGLTFRSGSFGGFIPIPFDKIVSGIFSVFQPTKSQAAQLTAPGPMASPQPEQWRSFRDQSAPPETQPQLQPDGTLYTPPDAGVAGQDFYATPTPAELRQWEYEDVLAVEPVPANYAELPADFGVESPELYAF